MPQLVSCFKIKQQTDTINFGKKKKLKVTDKFNKTNLQYIKMDCSLSLCDSNAVGNLGLMGPYLTLLSAYTKL